ncbi:MAG: DNA-methyltransferase [Promethearchaeota archaeon]
MSEDLYQIYHGDCISSLKELQANYTSKITLTFLDPPFNQDKDYPSHDDNLPKVTYWKWMESICKLIFDLTKDGGSIYFMQREKNTFHVWRALEKAGWVIQNLIIWKKMTSAVPQPYRFSKHYQIILFAIKGNRTSVFNRMRIDLPLYPHQKKPRKNGVYVTDVWDDIKELTSGYFAGDEALRNEDGQRIHKQQAPIALLTRILLSSSNVGDFVLDPFAGTGTTAVVAKQLKRKCIVIEMAKEYYNIIKERISKTRAADRIDALRHYYRYTENLDSIWPSIEENEKPYSIENFLQSNGD